MRYINALIVFIASLFLVGCIFVNTFEDFNVYFLDEPCITPGQQYTYLTCDPLHVVIYRNGFITSLIIPAKFKTDLASIPRWLWPIIAPTRSDIMGAAILHDYLYSAHSGFTRYQVDQIFLESLLDSGTPPFRAYEMFIAVRLFGGMHYGAGKCHAEN